MEHLTHLGIGPEWKFLEVGAGGGSVAAWMSGQVGSAGVVAMGIDVGSLAAMAAPNLEVRNHGFVNKPPWRDFFDIVHARLELSRDAERQLAMERLIASLTPGGWMLVEEFDSRSMTAETLGSPFALLLMVHICIFRKHGRR